MLIYEPLWSTFTMQQLLFTRDKRRVLERLMRKGLFKKVKTLALINLNYFYFNGRILVR